MYLADFRDAAAADVGLVRPAPPAEVATAGIGPAWWVSTAFAERAVRA